MTVVPVVPLVPSVSLAIYVSFCCDSGTCSASGALGVCVAVSVRCCGDSGVCGASGALGVQCCFCEVLR